MLKLKTITTTKSGQKNLFNRHIDEQRRKMKALQALVLEVGFYDDRNNLLPLFAYQLEFGSSRIVNGNRQFIPPRPYFRRALPKGNREMMRYLVKLGRFPNKDDLAAMGKIMQNCIEQEIESLKSPANAPRTLAKKQGSNPLVDSTGPGSLKNSVEVRIKKG